MLALMSDSKYGYRFYDNTLSLGLLRGSFEPDPTPEIEPTSFRLAISVLPAFDSAALVKERSVFLNRPVYCSARPGTGHLPTEGQLLRVDGNVCVSALKNRRIATVWLFVFGMKRLRLRSAACSCAVPL